MRPVPSARRRGTGGPPRLQRCGCCCDRSCPRPVGDRVVPLNRAARRAPSPPRGHRARSARGLRSTSIAVRRPFAVFFYVMLYALDQNGRRIEPSRDALGTCELCGNPVIPKCGTILRHHWSHRAVDCDPWGESETEWHRGWKLRANPECREVVLGNHRSDIRHADGLVIELQHSSIIVDDILARETFM